MSPNCRRVAVVAGLARRRGLMSYRRLAALISVTASLATVVACSTDPCGERAGQELNAIATSVFERIDVSEDQATGTPRCADSSSGVMTVTGAFPADVDRTHAEAELSDVATDLQWQPNPELLNVLKAWKLTTDNGRFWLTLRRHEANGALYVSVDRGDSPS